MRNRVLLQFVTAVAVWLGQAPTGQAQVRSVGTIAGTFDVSAGGSARYSIPLRVSPGTAGTAPDLSVSYDSQASGSVLGAGWSLGGVSAITRGARNLYSDGVVDGVRFADTDALFLDGQKLVQIAASGAGPARRVEYRKEAEDVTRVVQTGDNLNSATFLVQTKGGVTLRFDGSNGSTVRTADGSALLWSASRIVDTTGNYIEFRYNQNGQGEHTVVSIRYTGHEVRDGSGNIASDRLPFAAVDFVYDAGARPVDAYVSGRLIRRTARLKSVTSRVAPGPSAGPTDGWTVAGRYDFEYAVRETANRFVLTRVRQFGDDGSELEPIEFGYSEPNTAWKDAGFQLPVAVLASPEKFSHAYRFAHFTESGQRSDLLFSALFDGKLEAYAFRNDGAAWTPLDDFKPPFAFVSGDGTDLGALVTDLNGDGRADLLQSTRTGSASPVRSAHLADQNKWAPSTGYELPFNLSEDGKQVAIVRLARFTGSARDDLLYQSGANGGFLVNTGSGWQPDPAHAPPVPLTSAAKALDADCDSRPDLLVEQGSGWRVYRFEANHWEPLPGAFAPALPGGLEAAAIALADLNGDQCLDLVVSSAKAGVRKALLASAAGWSESTALAPTFDLVDQAGIELGAAFIDLNGDGKVDVLANRRDAGDKQVQFAYTQSSTGWDELGDAFVKPVLLDRTNAALPVSSAIVDIDADGLQDVARPSGRRDGFGHMYANSGTAAGFAEKPDFAPDIAFSRRDQQDRGVRFIDLNGDGLSDLIFRRDVTKEGATTAVSGAYINTGKGWRAAPGFVPPQPFASDTIAGNPVQLFDADLDGYIDLLYSYRKADGALVRAYYRNEADGASRKWVEQRASSLILPQAHPVAAEQTGDQGVRFVDLNGDSRVDMLVGVLKAKQIGGQPVDICKTLPNGQQCELNRALFEVAAFLNDGSAWVPSADYAPKLPFVARAQRPQDATTDLFVQIVDVDGDRLPDIVARFKHPHEPTREVSEVWLNTGKGWKTTSLTVPLLLDEPIRNPRALAQWFDVNGDGLVDLIYSERQGGMNRSKTWLSTGARFVEAANWQVPLQAIADKGGDPSFRLVDLNGDGWLDVMYSRLKSATEVERGAYFSNGTTWIAADAESVSRVPAMIDDNSLDLGVRLLDVDGNGLLDVVKSYARGESGDAADRLVLLNVGRRADVLNEVRPGYGATTTIYYQTLLETVPPSPAAASTTNLWARVYEPPSAADTYPVNSPVPTSYVVRRTVVEGAGQKAAQLFRYGEYRMHVGAMKPLGFAWRESLNEVSQLLVRTEYSQQIETAGRLTREATCLVRADQRPGGEPVPMNLCEAGAVNSAWRTKLNQTTSRWEARSMAVDGPFPASTVRQIHLASSTVTTWELDRQQVSSEVTELTYDEPTDLLDRRLNVVRLKISRSDGTSIDTTNEYDQDDSTLWFFGRLTRTTVERRGDRLSETNPARKSEQRVTSFVYDADTGLLKKSTLEPNSSLALSTDYSRDRFGNVEVTITSAPNELPRRSGVRFDPLGRFIVEEINPLQHSVRYTRHQVHGLPLIMVDANAIETTYAYDGFGRLRLTRGPTKIDTVVERFPISSGQDAAGVPAAYAERSKVGALPATLHIFDAYGRPVRIVAEGFSLNGTAARPIYTDRAYDALGRTVRSSVPYDRGEIPLWTEVKYDALSRATSETRPDGLRTTREYRGRAGEGRILTMVDALGKRVRTELNTRGLAVKITDNRQGTVTYEYDAGDRIETVRGPTGAIARTTYDEMGHRRSSYDPDMGLWTYRHDAFGQLLEQTDAKGQTSLLEYDMLGRLVRRSASDGTTAQWEYDTAAKGVGNIKRIRDPGRFEKEFFYDTYGRLRGAAITVGAETFTTTQDLDAYGRVWKTRYPVEPGLQPVVVQNNYDPKGFLTRITSENGGALFWEALAYDAIGRVTRERFGNDVVGQSTYDRTSGLPTAISARKNSGTELLNLAMQYDATGNLTTRQERVRGVDEKYSYDALDRLASFRDTAGNLHQFDYDLAGRITNKAKDGLFSYRSQSTGGPWQPYHAVLEAKDGLSVRRYTYDPNGNMAAGAGLTFSFTSDNRLREVSSSATKWARFDYDPGGMRYRRVSREGSRASETIYVGSFERVREFSASNMSKPETLRFRYYLAGPSGTFAVIDVKATPTSGVGVAADMAPAAVAFATATTNVWYLHRDHLGSIVRISDRAGALAVRLWYDPWGRQVASWYSPDGEDFGETLARGFTGHEHLAEFDIIHMNGRVYSTRNGLFISPDPVGLAATYTQTLGRYQYGLNNPLKYVDPTGYWSWGGGLVGGLVGLVTGGPGGAVVGFLLGGHDETREWIEQNWKQVVIVGVAVGVTAVTAGTAGPILAGMAAGAASGGLGAALYGGSMEDVLEGAVRGAVIGGVSAGAFYAVGTAFSGAAGSIGNPDSIGAIAAHGVVGGGMSAVEGGDFWTGFSAGAFTKFSSAHGPQFDGFGANLARAAVVGGTASAITGGKFSNGAVIGAFSYAFNDAAHEIMEDYEQSRFEKWVASLPEIPQDASNLIQGFGSGLSFGLTDQLNTYLGAGNYADRTSGMFLLGDSVGAVVTSVYPAGAMRGAAYLGNLGREYRALKFINGNRYIRFGYTKVPDSPFTYGSTYRTGRVGPTMRIGKGPPNSWNHWDLRVLGK